MTTMINPERRLSSQDTAEQLFRQPVPPRLVRRTHQSDVFVTNLRVTGVDTFEVSAQLPVTHSFYGPVRPGLHDPLLLLEAIRESILLVGHFAYDIPREYKWITHTKRFDFDPAGLLTNGDYPADVTIKLSHHDIKRRGRRPAAMRTEVECYRAGIRIGTAMYDWSVVSGPAYKKLRGQYVDAQPSAPAGVTLVWPDRVGRENEIDVLLAEWPEGPGWQVRVDPDHPVIYDHSVDHVPGNAVAEIVRQAAQLATGRPDALPVGADFRFDHYLEFDTPCVVSTELVGETSGGRTGVRFVVEQNGHRSVEGVFEVQFC